MQKTILVTKADGTTQPFSREKLIRSLRNAGASEELAENVTERVENIMVPGATTKDIYRHAFKFLKESPAKTSARYSLRKAVTALGPTGFPFEMLLGEVLRHDGFETSLDSIIQGRCITHEVDVLAWNKEKVIVIEAKFHNEHGIRTDIKDTLYVKARFDDLEEAPISIQGEDRQVNEGWLVTNTKFSSMSIEYAMCQHMHLIGWNYPHQGNLQQRIEEHGLHPITVLSSLTHSQIRELLDRGAVLCRHLRENRDIMMQIGMSASDIEHVINEINEIC
jgi:hypothetical protein